MLQGNINKDRTVFSWTEGGRRRSHTLDRSDILLTSSISGDEVILQQRGKPTQFMFIDGRDLHRIVTRDPRATVYISPDVLDRYGEVFATMAGVRVVWPSHTRSTQRRGPQQSSGARPSGSEGASSSARPPSVIDLDDGSEQQTEGPALGAEQEETEGPALGLYEWIGRQPCTLKHLLCRDSERSDYLRQVAGVRAHCSTPQFDALTKDLHCEQGQGIHRCVTRNLLRFLHPDKVGVQDSKCAEAITKEVTSAYNEVRDQPGFREDQACP